MESVIHLHPNNKIVTTILRISEETIYLSIKRESPYDDGASSSVVEEFTIFGSMLQLRYIVDQLAQQIETVPEKTISEELGL